MSECTNNPELESLRQERDQLRADLTKAQEHIDYWQRNAIYWKRSHEDACKTHEQTRIESLKLAGDMTRMNADLAAERERREKADRAERVSRLDIIKIEAERDAARAEVAALRKAMLSALSATNATVSDDCTTEFLCLGADEIRLHIKKIKAERDAARAEAALYKQQMAEFAARSESDAIAIRARVAELEKELAAALLAMRNVSAVVLNSQATREQPYRVYETIRAHLNPLLTKQTPMKSPRESSNDGHEEYEEDMK